MKVKHEKWRQRDNGVVQLAASQGLTLPLTLPNKKRCVWQIKDESIEDILVQGAAKNAVDVSQLNIALQECSWKALTRAPDSKPFTYQQVVNVLV